MSLLGRIFGKRDSAPTSLPSPDELVPLTRVESDVDATLYRDILQDNGISALIKNHDVLTAQSGVMASPWSQELWVLRKDLRRAKELLEV